MAWQPRAGWLKRARDKSCSSADPDRGRAGIQAVMKEIEALGAQARAVSVDISNAEQVEALIAEVATGPFELKGIIHGAMVLDDAMMENVTEESFAKVCTPKVAGALNLVAALPAKSSLDFIVFYSSISAVIGNRGQTSYVAANSTLDGLAQMLRGKGIPALSINWGALSETGVIARDERLEAVLSSAGITGLKNREALEILEEAIRLAKPQIGAFKIDWQTWHNSHPKLNNDPRFREQRIRSRAGGENDVASNIRKELAQFSKEQRLRILEEQLQDVLANTLKMSKDTISVNRKVNEMGVDSLMVLELSLGIKERIGVNFSAMEFLKGPTIRQLATMAESKLWADN